MKKRWTHIETDDTCAICGWRGKEDLTIHHIDGDSSNSVYENEILVCHNCHIRHHQAKRLTTEAIKERKQVLIHRTLTPPGVNALKIAARGEEGVVGTPFLLNHLVDLGFLEGGTMIQGYGELTVQAVFTTTERGRQLVIDWL